MNKFKPFEEIIETSFLEMIFQFQPKYSKYEFYLCSCSWGFRNQHRNEEIEKIHIVIGLNFGKNNWNKKKIKFNYSINIWLFDLYIDEKLN